MRDNGGEHASGFVFTQEGSFFSEIIMGVGY